MSDQTDTSTLGLKCGLEIHQQLDTGKLFCRCPSVIREEKPNIELCRYLRAAEGETGEVDLAARHERFKAKRFRYLGYQDTTCLVELDEEPPQPINERAVEATVQFAKLVGATSLEEVHVMRKTVVDGSNTSGFQRTALVAIGGRLPEEEVRIQSVCLEEDAAKISSRSGAEDSYNLSRLGIPLIEVATEPDITTPEQAQRTAAEIGMLLRSTGKCRRGLGTIRQDLNVSIKGGARVEIKGAQDLKLLPLLVRNEALRQQGLIRLRDELKRRGMTELLPSSSKHVTKQLHRTKCSFLASGMKNGSEIIGILVPDFLGLFSTELFPHHRLGAELAGYARAFGFGGLIHSDEDHAKYPLSDQEIAAVRKQLGAKKKDAFVLVMGDPGKVNDFFAFLFLPRLERLLHDVPSEVRKAERDGTSSFLRPMPGAARMYPETDLPRLYIDASRVPKPEVLKEQETSLQKKFKISATHAKALLKEGWDLPSLTTTFPHLNPAFIATTLLETPKEIRRRYGKELSLAVHEPELRDILSRADSGAVPREAVIELLRDVAQGKAPDFTRYAQKEEKEIKKVVQEVIAADPDAPLSALMGKAMARLRGKAPGSKVMALLKALRK